MGATITVDEIRALFKDSVSSVVREEMSKVGQGSGASDVVAALRTFGIGRKPQDVDKGKVLGRLVRSLMATRFDPYAAIQQAKAKWADQEKDLFEAVEKAMSAGTGASGGFWLPSEMASQIIDYLDSEAVVRSTGVQVMPLDYGTMDIPKVTSGPTGHYVGEAGAAAVSQMGAGQVKLVAKELVAIVPITLRLLTFGGDMADNIVRRGLVRSLGTTEDRAFLRGTGSEYAPKGMRYLAPSASITATNGSDLASVRADLQELWDALEGADVRMENPVIFMNPRSKNYLKYSVSDGNGNLVFAPEIREGKLSEATLKVTTSVPKNLGAGGDESELILCDMSYAVIGQATQIMLSGSDQASYVDENDVTHSCFQENITLVKATIYNDFALTQDQACAVKTGVQYGA